MAKEIFNIIKGTNENYSLYVYGDIISGSDKWDDSDVTLDDFKNALDEITPNSILNIYISSGGGSVFTTQTMMTMLDRCKKEKKCSIKAHLDGLAASCASFLPMIADEIIVYKNSVMMLHKPMSMAWGNANEIQKTIDLLNKLEDSIMIPAYLSKCKPGVTKEKIKSMLDAETWLNASEICDLFNVTYVDEEKSIAASVDYSIVNKYKNVPEGLRNKSFFNAQNSVTKQKNNTQIEMSEETKKLLAKVKAQQEAERIANKYKNF